MSKLEQIAEFIAHMIAQNRVGHGSTFQGNAATFKIKIPDTMWAKKPQNTKPNCSGPSSHGIFSGPAGGLKKNREYL